MPIKLENVSYTYDAGTTLAVRALRGVTLDAADGEFIGVMGAAGSGKSTLAQLIAGLIKPTEGQILLDREDINARKYDRGALHRKVGLVFQHPEHQLFETTVERDVGFGLRRLGLTKEETAAAVRAALEIVGLDYDAVRDKSLLGFSDGEKRRIAIAGVLAPKPGVLILDEPTAGLDPLGRRNFLNMVDALNAAGTTIIMTSHDADALAEHARRIIVLKNGALIRDGSTRDVFSDYYDLLHNGIGVPQVRRAAQLLRERGVDMPGNIIQYDEFIDRLKIIMWRKSR